MHQRSHHFGLLTLDKVILLVYQRQSVVHVLEFLHRTYLPTWIYENLWWCWHCKWFGDGTAEWKCTYSRPSISLAFAGGTAYSRHWHRPYANICWTNGDINVGFNARDDWFRMVMNMKGRVCMCGCVGAINCALEISRVEKLPESMHVTLLEIIKKYWQILQVFPCWRSVWEPFSATRVGFNLSRSGYVPGSYWPTVCAFVAFVHHGDILSKWQN